MDYKSAGVDIEAGYRSVELMKEHVKKTMRSEVLTNLGGFSGAFSMEKFKQMEKPTLVSGTDGVGTKLKLAFLLDKHDTVGIDCVAMSMIRSASTASRCVSMISPAQAVSRFSSWTILHAERIILKKSRRS